MGKKKNRMTPADWESVKDHLNAGFTSAEMAKAAGLPLAIFDKEMTKMSKRSKKQNVSPIPGVHELVFTFTTGNIVKVTTIATLTVFTLKVVDRVLVKIWNGEYINKENKEDGK